MQVDNITIPPGRTVATGTERLDVWSGWQPLVIEAYRTTRRGHALVRFRLRTVDRQWFSGGSWLTLNGALAFARWQASNTPLMFRHASPKVAEAAMRAVFPVRFAFEDV
jgi:hypothetical protein